MAKIDRSDNDMSIEASSGADEAPAARTQPAFARPPEAIVENGSHHYGDPSDDQLRAIRAHRAGAAEAKPERAADGKFKASSTPEKKPAAAQDATAEHDDAGEDETEDASVEDAPEDDAAVAPETDPPSALTDAERRLSTAMGRLDSRADEVRRAKEEYEKEYAPRVKQLEAAADKIAASPMSAFADFMEAALGISAEEAKAETDRAFEEWAGQQLGVVKGSSKASSESATSRKVLRELQRFKQEQRTAQELLKAEATDREYVAEVGKAIDSIESLISESEFPLLYAFADKRPAELVWDVIAKASEGKSGRQLSPAEAAKLANDYYKPRAEFLRHHLLGSGSAPAPKGSAPKTAVGEDKKPAATAPSKKPRTLTDATASVTPARSEVAKPVYESPEDEKLAAIRKHRSAT